ncbi:5-bromo-4-chloroindolyl phosphate hydrolysis family protein [Sinanaerobacter chloroacetimidivorans]|jgi:5-bromo-4-chloroindolyl phosphate hydrolysis protein|uniref:5-bromo-4-chloroindolyl phosphate hydrolysis family protein n=1 Tax=Sinanaerobacter chloroacetimidivorans TaxID=2818044 RepID=A0A8J8B3C0_9FIRM|nr:5-bromo-4-chloroindolyl phosphate hydrolysis family protein [Sinanaerobacter chloroacetimidivorans]MBR0599636.1 5-bromo-4-chloroindolyl phosphate hydrolysis family protein [Sinanaerobacter chloroacetimidivorans]
MKNDNFIDFGEEISRTVRKVLNGQEMYDLRHMINHTMRNVPGMGGGPFYEGPFKGDKFPRLSKEEKNEDGNFGSHGNYGNSGSYGSYGSCGSQHGKSRGKSPKGASFVPSTLFLVFGSISAVASGLTLLAWTVLEVTIGNLPGAEAIEAVFGGLFLVSLALIMIGSQLRKRAKRLRLYLKVLNGRTFCTIKELSAASGKGTKFIIKDLRKMIHAGLFSEGYMDEQETCLMTDYKTYTQYLETVKYAKEQQEIEKREKEKWANRQGGAELKETIDEGNNYIRTIKAANDALPEAEISEKLDQLELVTTKIFNYVEQHPEKLPEIRKFMCYYMPITLKLVNAYQKFEQHGTKSEEIEATKLEIKGTLDTINKAYLNLLNKLMQADILDVSSDISALETILAQEGLTEEDFKA